MTHEYTIEEIVRGNVAMAIDQADEYGGLEGAFQSFNQNVADSLLEDGYDPGDVMTAQSLFTLEFKTQTGLEY
jgi:hypothetical protein